MRLLFALQGALLAIATSHEPRAPSEVPFVNTTYTNYALNPMFTYTPKMEWPRAPSDGWNFSTATGASSPYDPPERRLAYPYTTLPGAEVGQRFVGNGASVSGWAAAGTRFRLAVDEEHAAEYTVASETEGELARVMTGANDWMDIRVTLREGALQVFNISIHQLQRLESPQDKAPQPTLLAVEEDGATISPFFKVEGDVVPKIGDIEGEGRLVAMEPGARLSFRTWPNATMIRLLGQVGREGGVVAYGMEPEPANVRTVKWDLLRTHDYFMDVGYHLLDPRQRFTFKVWNDHPRSRIYFRGVSFLVGVNAAMDRDPLTDTMKGEINSTGTPSKGDGQGNGQGNYGGSGGSGNGGKGSSSGDDSGGTEQKDRHTNAGAIAGGVVGGLVGAVLLGLLLLAYLFPARFRRLLPGGRTHAPPTTGFVVDHDDVLDVSGTASDPVVTPLPAPEPKPEPKPPATEHELWTTQSEKNQLLPDNPSSGSHPAVEDDAGPVPVRHVAETLPPTYNPAWASSASGGPSGSGPEAGPSDYTGAGSPKPPSKSKHFSP